MTTASDTNDPGPLGSPVLIVLRGNSGSGKSAVAAEIRRRYGVRRLAIVGQDNLRRTVLRERDVPGGANIGLIEHTAAYALEAGFHAIVEGIMYADRYGEMLHRLRAAHVGPAFFYYLDVPFEETLKRHAGKPQAAGYGRPEMTRWWREKDFLPGGIEDIITVASTLDETVTRIMRDTGLDGSVTPAAPAGTPPQSPIVPLPEPAMWQSVSKLHAYHRETPPEIQVLKLAEEVGEAAEAFIGMIGANRRKGVCKTRDDVLDELGDVVITAAVAMTGLAGSADEAAALFQRRLAVVLERAGLA